MNRSIAASCAFATLLLSTPAFAQLGGLSGRLKQAQEAKDKLAELKMSEADERKLGEQVSLRLRQEFGVYQDKEVAKYVSLVGRVLAQGSSRPGLDWQFIVLDTDGVNAFASPGGLVHVTRGALGLIKNEAELAGVLGHEITHVTAKHTVRSIQKNKAVSLGAGELGGSGGLAQSVLSRLAEAAYKNVINNAFDRDDEVESDRIGIALANKAGYAPGALADVLKRLEERNRSQEQPNGMFASHPLIKDRLANIAKVIREDKLVAAATVAPRYAKYVTFDVKPLGDIPVIEGTRGLTGGAARSSAEAESKDKDKDKKEPPKKKGGLLGKIGLTSGSQGQNTQTVASAGARGLGQPDRDAKGGGNPNKVTVMVSASELADFKKGIV
jgi:beta-barrel assembly-enhancing protease